MITNDDRECHCVTCNNQLVYLSESTLTDINRALRPNFRTLQSAVHFDGRMMYPICPYCDTYALGIDMEAGFPFVTASGESKTIHDAAYGKREG